MRIRTAVLSFVFLVGVVASDTADARTATAAERTACEAKIQPKIDTINSKLRAGYTAKEGERLKELRRRLAEQLANCRKVS